MANATGNSSAETDVFAARWYLTGAHRAVWNVPIAAALIMFLAVMMVRSQSQDPVQNLQQSRADLLALQPKPIDDEVNAATAFHQAYAAIVPYKGPSTGVTPEVALSYPSDQFERADIIAHFKANAFAIQQIRAAADMPECNWGYDYKLGYAIPLPFLSSLRQASRMLAGDARLHAHNGDHKTAAAEIAAIYRISRMAAKDPILICGLVALACNSIADNAIESILAFDPPTSADDVQAYRDALWADRRPVEQFQFAMRGERAINLYTLDMLGSKPGGAWAGNQIDGPGMPDAVYSLIYGSERQCAQDSYDDVLAVTARGEMPGDGAFTTAMNKHRNGPVVLGQFTLPLLDRSAMSFKRSQEQAWILQIALAVQAFRVKQHRDPKSLDELVPEFLPKLPASIFGGGFNIARATGEPTVPGSHPDLRSFFVGKPVLKVYSFWQNGIDDGGNWGSTADQSDGLDHVVRLVPYSEEESPFEFDAGHPAPSAPAAKAPVKTGGNETLQEPDR